MANCGQSLPVGYWQEADAMQEFSEIDRMIVLATDEIKEWKAMMEDLAGIFYNRFPAKRKYGWTLHLDRCSKSKECAMCPHSIFWVRYYYVKLKEETKKAMQKNGKNAPNHRISWDNTKKGRVKKGLPADLKVSPLVRSIFEEFEEVRSVIMEQHRALSKLRKGLLAKKQTAERIVKKTDITRLSYFDSGIMRAFQQMLVPYRPTREEVVRKLYQMRKKYYISRD